jgi:hypothetical protein
LTACGFNPACYVWTAIEPFWIWITWGFWIAVALTVLWALAKLKEVGGWPAVTAAVGAAAYAIGYWRRSANKPLIPRVDNVTELEDGPDIAPPAGSRRRKPIPKPTGSRRRFNHETGNFEDY